MFTYNGESIIIKSWKFKTKYIENFQSDQILMKIKSMKKNIKDTTKKKKTFNYRSINQLELKNLFYFTLRYYLDNHTKYI